jgi:hypothetical protein
MRKMRAQRAAQGVAQSFVSFLTLACDQLVEFKNRQQHGEYD